MLKQLILVSLLALFLNPFGSAQGQAIGYEESFALAADREAALEQLIPGTAEFYYYSCLVHQHRSEFDKVPGLIDTWVKRHGHTARVREIEHRQALLAHGEDSNGSYHYLRRVLGLDFQHRARSGDEAKSLPSQLDPTTIGTHAWIAQAHRNHPQSIKGFTDRALEGLAGIPLTDRQLGQWLSRLQRPDVPGLPARIIRHLALESSSGFGSLPIHTKLLIDQLDTCLSLAPHLLNDPEFVKVYLTKLAPNSSQDWRTSTTVREAFLERLQAFAARLGPSHNALKAHVLHHRLIHDLGLGKPNRETLLAFLQVPSKHEYSNRKWLKQQRQAEIVQARDQKLTLLGAPGDAEPLVRAYLEHFFIDDQNPDSFAKYLGPAYLARVFAETKILGGIGDQERWYSMLDDPAYYEELQDRVEIGFPPDQSTQFAVNEGVTLDVTLKNVNTLLVKVFEMDALSYGQTTGREVQASLDLDGMVATHEETHTFDEPALRRKRHQFEFPEVTEPGVYVIDFIGAGTSSRAVIRKGSLQVRHRLNSAGHVIEAVTPDGNPCSDADAYAAGSHYRADKANEIVIPFSANPTSKKMTVHSAGRVRVESLPPLAEEYTLEAGIYVAREQLLAGATAQLVISPRLFVQGHVAPLSLVEEASLRITATRRNGTTTSVVVPTEEFAALSEWVHEFRVPDDLSLLEAQVTGSVLQLSSGEKVRVHGKLHRFTINQIDATEQILCPLLGHDSAGYFIDVLGKNGEAGAGHPVTVTLTHRDYTNSMKVHLKTDEAGRIRLGPLPKITSLRVTGLPNGYGQWSLSDNAHSGTPQVHGRAGQTLQIPYTGDSDELNRLNVSLLERRGGVYTTDHYHRIALNGHMLEISGLPAGDYELLQKEGGHFTSIRVVAGSEVDGWAMGSQRSLELTRPTLQILSAELDDGDITIALNQADASTRIHLFGSRFVPATDPFVSLVSQGQQNARLVWAKPSLSEYHTGRKISSEFRYILERRYAAKFPGNMLRRPGLLLNPWALRDTNSMIGLGGGAGGKFGGRGGGGASPSGPRAPSAKQGRSSSPSTFPNLDFMNQRAAVLTNLRPDADGLLHIPAEALGLANCLQIIAVDENTLVSRRVLRSSTQLQTKDLKLTRGLDPTQHVGERRRIEALQSGDQTTLRDQAGSDLQSYSSLAEVFDLFRTLQPQAGLGPFRPLMDWPSLTLEARQAFYSEFASHEVNLFLARKDPEFFSETVSAYIANKADKTFVDDWLLGNDLESYSTPFEFGRLNTLERILLARRMPKLAASVSRLIAEQLELQPEDSGRSAGFRFDTIMGTTLALSEKAKELRSPIRYKGPGDSAPPPSEDRPMEELDFEGVVWDEKPAGVTGGEDFMLDARRELDQRGRTQNYFRELGVTELLVETQYYQHHTATSGTLTVEANEFWLDLAEAQAGEPFISTHFAEPTGNLGEMLLALAMLDLPFTPADHTSASVEGEVQVNAKGPLLLVAKELTVLAPTEEPVQLLMGQQYRALHSDSAAQADSMQFVRAEPYVCRVVISNPTAAQIELELLVQIPNGALPVSNGYRTQGLPVTLQPFGSHTHEYSFYFPNAGQFTHFPAHASHDGAMLAFAAGNPTMEVSAEATAIDRESWEHLSQRAELDTLLEQMRAMNLQAVDLSQLAWRMRDGEAFNAIITALRDRSLYSPTLWSYGLFHQAPDAAREYLAQNHSFVSQCGSWLASDLLTIDPVQRRTFEQLEFDPLINARVHPTDAGPEILNRGLAGQYMKLLDILAHKPVLEDEDWMSLSYMLLLQDRIAEAQGAFDKVNREKVDMEIQYDYMQAYMDFFQDDPQLAGEIAKNYRNYPVLHWRTRFGVIEQHLQEAAGVASATPEGSTSPLANNDDLAGLSPTLDLHVEGGSITIEHSHLESCELRFYPMDVEFLFSSQPSVGVDSNSSIFVKAAQSVTVQLDPNGDDYVAKLPEQFQTGNTLIEVRAGSLTRIRASYANSLRVQMIDAFGQLKVSHSETGRPLPKTYVKVFVKDGRNTRFHKDGYTDLRGRFDYVSVSEMKSHGIERFYVLILHEEHGAAIREVGPPPK